MEWVKIMLGCPIVGMQLCEEQIQEAFNTAQEDFIFFTSILSENEKSEKLAIKKNWVKKYTLAICKEILGRVRGQYQEATSGTSEADRLLKESMDEKNFLIRMCLNNSKEQFVLINKNCI